MYLFRPTVCECLLVVNSVCTWCHLNITTSTVNDHIIGIHGRLVLRTEIETDEESKNIDDVDDDDDANMYILHNHRRE